MGQNNYIIFWRGDVCWVETLVIHRNAAKPHTTVKIFMETTLIHSSYNRTVECFFKNSTMLKMTTFHLFLTTKSSTGKNLKMKDSDLKLESIRIIKSR